MSERLEGAWWEDTDVEPYASPDGDLRLLAEQHRCLDGYPPYCTCGSRWPCDLGMVLCHAAEQAAELARYRRALEALMIDPDDDEAWEMAHALADGGDHE